MGDDDRDVFLLGLTSFFNDVGSETLFTLLPLYVGQGSIGFLGGIIHGLGEITKVYFGYVSDRLGKRKPVVMSGYALSIISKFFVPLVDKSQIFAALLVDRLGKGVREGPRDAIISLSKRRGWAFGVQKAMDTLGAVVGSLFAFAFVYLGGNFRVAMIMAAFVGLLSLVPLTFVKVRPTNPIKADFASAMKKSSEEMRGFLMVSGLFGLALVSPLLIIGTVYDSLGAIGLLGYVAFNVVYATSSNYMGALSDRIGRRNVINVSFFSVAAAFLLIYAGGFAQLMGLMVYGLAFGAFKSVSKAFVGDICVSNRATAMGLFQAVLGLSIFLGSTAAGLVMGSLGNGVYLIGTGISLAAVAGFKLLV